ncbi:uncharacterized protein UV8b_04794 [Ustilaginoidea virens]|uniref:Uncharacterized protein n=1 Tax=Ustilaginoidea virens TaxID=1159556 RepID=A0A8E5MHI2_USTVR|nr:uncharacterized protein UV8b_04794 [Ustilaginoidea virens]QUC20553.1 hypothetical protein UV8b_04794 [Ustilaginoidea virens]
MCLSLLAQVMESTARSSELYIMAMLTIGGHILLVPIYAWRVITCCNSSWGALHHSQSQRIPRVLRVVDFVTVVVASSVAVWLFAVRLPEPGMFCNEYGFLFGKASMRDWSFAVSNTALYICILVVCVALVLLRWVCLLHKVNSRRYSRLKERCRRTSHARYLASVRVLSDTVVWAMLIATIEMTIVYNDLGAAQDFGAAAQLFAFSATLVTIVRAWWLRFNADGEGSSERVAQYYRWPGTYEEWAAARENMHEYQQAMDAARDNERLLRQWRRQVRKAYRANYQGFES